MKKATLFLLITVLFIGTAVLSPVANAERNKSSGTVNICNPSIDVQVSNSFATITAEFMMENTADANTEQRIEVRIPEGAFLSNLTIDYMGEVYYGVVKEANQAEKEYQEAVSENKNALKLEKKTVNRFGITINLEPESSLIIRYNFNMFLVKELGGYKLSLLPGNIIPGDISGPLDVDFEIESPTMITAAETVGIDMKYLDYKGTNTIKIETEVDSDELNGEIGVIYETDSTSVEGTAVFHSSQERTYFVHTFSPGSKELGGMALEKDIVFIIDTSGSMEGEKLDRTKEAFSLIVDELESRRDRFNIISFSSNVMVWKNQLQNTTDDNVSRAKDHIDDLASGGSTNIIESLEKGLEMFQGENGRMKIIVFLTDGNPTTGYIESPPAICTKIREKNTERISIFSLGVGYDMDFEFLERLSLDNYGRAYRIDDKQEISEQITDFYKTISTPLIFDLELNYGNAEKVYHRQAPYLFQGQEHCIVGRVSDPDTDVSFNGSGITVNSTTYFNEEFKPSDDINPNLEKYWAYMHIKWCEEKILRDDNRDIYEQELLDTALEHQIVTEYTTMIIVVEKEEREKEEEKEAEGEKEKNENTGNSGGTGGSSYQPQDDYSYDSGDGNSGGGGSSSKFDYSDDEDDDDGNWFRNSGSEHDTPEFPWFALPAILLAGLVIIVRRRIKD